MTDEELRLWWKAVRKAAKFRASAIESMRSAQTLFSKARINWRKS